MVRTICELMYAISVCLTIVKIEFAQADDSSSYLHVKDRLLQYDRTGSVFHTDIH